MGERGYGSVLALSLLLGGVLLVGLAVDVTRIVTAWRDASHAAHTAAEVGAGFVRTSDLYRGRLRLEPSSAVSEARDVLEQEGVDGRVSAGRRTLCVSATIEVEPGLIQLVGAGQRTVSARACAQPRQG